MILEWLLISPRCLLEATRLKAPLPDVLSDVLEACHLERLTVPDGSIHRPYNEEINKARSGVHGLDDITHDGHVAFDLPTPTWEDADRIAARVNPKWIYDPSRPSKKVVFTATHGTGPHAHVQVHANTRRRTANEPDDVQVRT